MPSYEPNYSDCHTWEDIVREHAKTIYIPAALKSDDENLSAALIKANASYDPPSATEAGPTLESLLSHPSTSSILSSPIHDSIKGKDATALIEMMVTGQVAVVDMTKAFLAKTSIVHQATSCLSHYFYDDALRRATELDDKRQRYQSQNRLHELGPLFGLPMSIKGHIAYNKKGSQRGFVFDVLSDPSSHPLVRKNLTQEQIELLTESQGGYVSENPVNAHVAQLLLDADAVILCKTTMPQGVMHLDDRSNLYGQALNPWNLHLSPGGSSGGESALIAGGGTALGVGSDIGGSIRQPSGVCGLYGLRPTTQRIPYGGVRGTMPGNEGVISSLGPMTLSLRDIDLFMSSLLNDKTRPWEKEDRVLPLPWRKVDSLLAQQKPITVGVMLDDGVVRPTAPIRRTMTSWLAKLGQHPQIQLKVWTPRDLHKRAWDLIRSLYFMDSGKLFHLLAKATGEPFLPLTEFILSAPFVRSATEDLHAVQSVDATRKLDEMTVTDLWAQVRKREAFRKEFLRQWNDLGLDCLLCPVMGNVAPRPGKIKYWGYTSVFNLVDYPGVVFPTGFYADAEADQRYEQQESSQSHAKNAEGPRYGAPAPEPMSEFDAENREEYERHRKVFDGAPVGLQLIGARFKDEEVVRYAELLENICKSSP